MALNANQRFRTSGRSPWLLWWLLLTDLRRSDVCAICVEQRRVYCTFASTGAWKWVEFADPSWPGVVVTAMLGGRAGCADESIS